MPTAWPLPASSSRPVSVVPAARLGVCHCHAGHGQGVVRIGRSCVAGPLAQAPRTRLPGSPGWTRGARTVSSAWSVPADQCTFIGAGLHGLGRGVSPGWRRRQRPRHTGKHPGGRAGRPGHGQGVARAPELALAPRLMEALVAGDHAAGDKRGRQSPCMPWPPAPGTTTAASLTTCASTNVVLPTSSHAADSACLRHHRDTRVQRATCPLGRSRRVG
jgi:hypothetical protein